MKVLVTGSRGQLGDDVLKELQRREIAYCAPTREELDITDPLLVQKVLEGYQPDIVIHCAAFTAVDKAEDEPELCWETNANATYLLAKECRKLDAKMLYLSTDYVFAGTGDQYHTEVDPVDPQNVYGCTKLAGEFAVRSLVEKFFIVRVSWLFGKTGNNFIKTMLNLAETHACVDVVCDQVGSPTYTVDLASLLCEMMITDQYGIYHATNEGICSWAEFAEEIFRLSGKTTKVNQVTSEKYAAKARRPMNSRLLKNKLEENGFCRLRDWHEALSEFLSSL